MSLYIPGISVSCCLDCQCSEWQAVEGDDIMWVCRAVTPRRRIKDKAMYDRQTWCPLIEVPLHGDLIDRALLSAFCYDDSDIDVDDFDHGVLFTLEAIDKLPVVIPEEADT